MLWSLRQGWNMNSYYSAPKWYDFSLGKSIRWLLKGLKVTHPFWKIVKHGMDPMSPIYFVKHNTYLDLNSFSVKRAFFGHEEMKWLNRSIWYTPLVEVNIRKKSFITLLIYPMQNYSFGMLFITEMKVGLLKTIKAIDQFLDSTNTTI